MKTRRKFAQFKHLPTQGKMYWRRAVWVVSWPKRYFAVKKYLQGPRSKFLSGGGGGGGWLNWTKCFLRRDTWEFLFNP